MIRRMLWFVLGCMLGGLAFSEDRPMTTTSQQPEEAKVRARHEQYFQALGSADMDALAENFTFPAAFKGFLDDVVLANDKASLIATYEKLIAAAPKATRTELDALDVGYVRPGVYMLTMSYRQYADDAMIHEGRAVYFVKKIGDDFKLFAVF